MSIGSLGLIGSLASSPLAQKGSDIDKAKTETSNQLRATDAAQRADAAAGIGTMHEDSQTSDRDADGRRLWEITEQSASSSEETADESVPPPRAKDPTGQAGSQLDLSG